MNYTIPLGAWSKFKLVGTDDAKLNVGNLGCSGPDVDNFRISVK